MRGDATADTLDQYYTRSHTAWNCWRDTLQVVASLRGVEHLIQLKYIDPAVGAGAFFRHLPEHSRRGVDLNRVRNRHTWDVEQTDFLEWDGGRPKWPKSRVVAITNPPFGPRGQTALAFFQHAATMAGTIAFILPMSFTKHGMQKRLPEEYQLRLEKRLPRDSFKSASGKPLEFNTVFQVWSTLTPRSGSPLDSPHDLRKRAAAPISHRDFDMWQYNNTEQALKVFDNDFDFAVPCQGWQDYTKKVGTAEECDKSKQWMLFKAKDSKVLARLNQMDFRAMAHSFSTIVPGFRKGDVVREYVELYET